MNKNAGWFDGVLELVQRNPDSRRANLLFASLNTAYRYGISTYITDDGLKALGVEGRRELNNINKYLKLPQNERNELKEELAVIHNEIMDLVIGIRIEL